MKPLVLAMLLLLGGCGAAGVPTASYTDVKLALGWRYGYTVAGKSPWCYMGVHNCDAENRSPRSAISNRVI